MKICLTLKSFEMLLLFWVVCVFSTLMTLGE